MVIRSPHPIPTISAAAGAAADAQHRQESNFVSAPLVG